MFKLIKTWRTKRKNKALIESYDRGYRWAMCAYFVDGMPMSEIEIIIDYPLPNSHFGTSEYGKSFDRGASEALTELNNFPEEFDISAMRRIIACNE